MRCLLISSLSSATSEAGALTRFATALRDGGFNPLAFTATEVTWSDSRPGGNAHIKAATTTPATPATIAPSPTS
jgi:hypothetical protein